MIRCALDRYIPAMISDDSFHDPNIYLFRAEAAALLDMQLEVSKYIRGLAADIGQMSRIATNERNAFTKSLTAAGGLIQFFFA